MTDTKPPSSIARKALILGVMPAFCVLLIVSIAFPVAGIIAARRASEADTEALVHILGDNVAAAIAFNDPNTASDVVAALRAKSNIDAACVFDADGRLFASYARDSFECAPLFQDSGTVADSPIVRTDNAMLGDRRVGIVRIFANYSALYESIVVQGLVTGAAIVFGGLLAMVLARRMQRTLSAPVLALATAAKQVTATGDYTVRVAKTTDDEVGAVADAFNRMLTQVHENSRLKDEFLAAMSHELRTPLNAILGWIQILKTGTPSQELRDRAMASLERNAYAQAKLVEDLLDVSRIVSGKLQLKMEAADLCELVSAAIEAVRPESARRKVELSVEMPDAPCLVSADRNRLGQVLGNLLSNGLKFTKPGGWVRLKVTAEPTQFAVSVSDNGIGMAPEFVPFVFDRFRQFDGTLTRTSGGLGLGLAIAKDIVGLHYGTIAAASPGLGHGSTFRIALPRLIATSNEPLAERPLLSSGLPQGLLTGVEILVVDDNQDALEVAELTLTAAGATVRTESSADQVLGNAQSLRYQVLLCDISMPGTDGLALLAGLRAQRAHTRERVAIALTAHADANMHQRCLDAGFDAHVTKPFETESLAELILRLLAQKRALNDLD